MHRIISIIGMSLVLMISCAPQSVGQTPRPGDLVPYATSTQAPPQTPEGLIPLTTPLPSPTPFTYTVQSGDTMSQIAERFNVSLDDLQAANPEVFSNAMSVGQVINIPSNPDNPSGEPTPTPASFTVEQIECYPTVERSMWCFVLVHNDLPDLIENISAQVTLVDSNGATLATQTAFLILDILPPNTSLPLAVYFSPEVPFDATPQVQILTAIRLVSNDERYIPSTVNNALVQVNDDGYSALVTGEVVSQSPSSAAAQVWVAATAYDEDGRVIGVRRWESDAGLPAGGSLPFQFMVSSIGGPIARVEFAVEARP
jgi:murein DD-endopeptidase MepM/ murein hydrolase activator NlpD